MANNDDIQAVSNARRTRIANICRWLLYMNPVVFDTETTGFGTNAEVVEISIVDARTEGVMYDSLIKPMLPMPDQVAEINHITNDMLADKTTMQAHYFPIRNILATRVAIAYNADFDIRLLMQSARAWNIDESITWLGIFDLMQLYAEFNGAWNGTRQCWQRIKLTDAAKRCGIEATGLHRALADTIVTTRLLAYMANWKPAVQNE